MTRAIGYLLHVRPTPPIAIMIDDYVDREIKTAGLLTVLIPNLIKAVWSDVRPSIDGYLEITSKGTNTYLANNTHFINHFFPNPTQLYPFEWLSIVIVSSFSKQVDDIPISGQI
ncbi:hypothetical protein ACTXT7_004450 [Hymenolepis weldensis]